MAIVRPSDITTERSSPVASEYMVVDNETTVAKSTIADVVNAGRPLANQAEAEAGVNATKAMTPLTTKQAINAQAVLALVAGDNTTIDATDPQNPVVSYDGSAVTDGDKGDVVVSGSGATWQIARRFDTVALLLADTDMDYTSGAQVVSAGQIVEAQGFRYDVADSTATDEHVETAGGVLLYLRKNADLTVYSDQAGIDASTTSAAAINKMLSDALAAGARTVKMAKGDWTPDGQIVWPVGLKELDWQGATFNFNTNLGDGVYPLLYNDNVVQIANLQTYASRDRETLTFVAPHGLKRDDIIGLRNTDASSLNTWRTTYFDGQITRVREVVSATVVTLWDLIDPRGPLNAFGSGNTEVFKFTEASRNLALRNLRMVGGTDVWGMAMIRGASDFETENLNIQGGSYGALHLNRCAYGRSEGLVAGNFGATTGNQYGVVHNSTCFHKTYGTIAYGTRHALQHGNDAGLGSVPPRGNEHYNVDLGSAIYAALDFGHGNILDHRCVGGKIQGIALGGSNNHIDVDEVTSPLGYLGGNRLIAGANFHDVNHKVRVGRLVVSGNGLLSGSPSSHGIIGFGGTDQTLDTNTVGGGILDIEIGTLDARNWGYAQAPLATYRNRGFTGRWGVRQRIGQVISPVQAPWFNCDAPSGSNPSIVDIGPVLPDRVDPSVTPTHGWTIATRGMNTPAINAGGQISAPVLVGTAANGGGAVASGISIAIAVSGFSGLTQQDTVSFGTSGALGGNFNVSAFVTSSTSVVIMVSNVTASGLTLPALTWTAYVTKRS